MRMQKPAEEQEHGRTRRHSQKPMAPSLSGRSRDLPRGHAAPAPLYGPLCRNLAPAETPAPGEDRCLWSAVRRRTHKRGLDRLAVWSRPPAAATGHRRGSLGMRNPGARRGVATSPSTWDTRRGCWGATRPLCPHPAPHRWGGPGSGAVGWATSTTVTWRAPWATWRAKGIPSWTGGGPSPTRGAKRQGAWIKPVCPTTAAALARVTRWRWRGWRRMAPHSRMAGSRVTTRGGVPLGGVVAGRRWAHARCWPCRRPRCGVLWRPPRPRRAGRGAGHSVPGPAWRRGARRSAMRPGTGSTGATVPQAPWGSTGANGVSSRARLGGSQATRSEGW